MLFFQPSFRKSSSNVESNRNDPLPLSIFLVLYMSVLSPSFPVVPKNNQLVQGIVSEISLEPTKNQETFLKMALFLCSIQRRCPLTNSSVNVLLSRTTFAHFPSCQYERKVWLPSALPSRVAVHLRGAKLLESLKASLVRCATSVRGTPLTWSS